MLKQGIPVRWVNHPTHHLGESLRNRTGIIYILNAGKCLGDPYSTIKLDRGGNIDVWNQNIKELYNPVNWFGEEG